MNDLESLLREDAQVPIDDNGFSARVMAALPPRASAAQRGWLTPALIFGSAALGSVLAVVLAPAGGPSLLQGFAELTQLRGFTPAAMTALALSFAVMVSALVLAMEAD